MFCHKTIVVQSKWLLNNGNIRYIFYNQRNWISGYVWFEYYINYYLPQYKEAIEQHGSSPEGYVANPMNIKLDKKWYSYIRLRESHTALILLLQKVHKYQPNTMFQAVERCIWSLCNKFVDFGVMHSKTQDELVNEKKKRECIINKYNFIKCRVLSWVSVQRSNAAARFHVHRGDFVFCINRPFINFQEWVPVSIKILALVQFRGLNNLYPETKDWYDEIAVFGELWLPCKETQWIDRSQNKVGNIYYVKDDQIPEYKRAQDDENGEPIYIVVRPQDMIEPLRKVRLCNGLNKQQAQNWHEFDNVKSLKLKDKINLCFYGVRNVDNIDKGGCFVYPVCQHKDCKNIGCMKHLQQNKVPHQFDVYHTCGFNGIDHICLASSLHGGNAHKLFEAGTFDSNFKLSDLGQKECVIDYQ